MHLLLKLHYYPKQSSFLNLLFLCIICYYYFACHTHFICLFPVSERLVMLVESVQDLSRLLFRPFYTVFASSPFVFNKLRTPI